MYLIEFYLSMASKINIICYRQRKNVRSVKINYKYSKYTELKFEEIGWKCIEKTCKAILYTIGIANNFSRGSVSYTFTWKYQH